MPTSDQLAGLTDYRKAREAQYAAERRSLDAVIRIANAGRAIEEATSRNDRAAAVQAKQELEEAGAARGQAAADLEKARDASNSARGRALGAGAGFDLLSARHPLLLLPVRLEARFVWLDPANRRSFFDDPGTTRGLLIRIFPDEVHDDAHQPELTPDEAEILSALAKRLQLARDLRDLDAAWADVIGKTGPARAGWLGEILARNAGFTLRPTGFSRAPVARLLPDRWLAIAELSDGSSRTAFSSMVREPLETSPAHGGTDWMIDFDAATAAGMAITVPDVPAPNTVRRLVVIGARGTLDPSDTEQELHRLLAAQHYTRGLSVLIPGTATNSVAAERAGRTARPATADVVALERRRFLIGMRPAPLVAPGDGRDGSTLASALGIPIEAFAYVTGADGTSRSTERQMIDLLVTAVRRHLTEHLKGIVDAATLDEALAFAAGHVSAAGPLPSVRIGAQPYGVLPLLVRGAAPLPADSFAGRWLPVLDRLRAVWTDAIVKIPTVAEPGSDPGQTLIRILQQDAIAHRVAFRPFLGPQLGAAALTAIEQRQIDPRRRDAARDLAAITGRARSKGALLSALHAEFAPLLRAPWVEPPDEPPVSGERAANYLPLIAGLRPDALCRHDYGGAAPPSSLLFALARAAMLERADAAARLTLIAGGAPDALWDNEEVPSVAQDSLGTAQRRLDAPDPSDPIAPVGFHLSEQGRDAAVMLDIRNLLRDLAKVPAGVLEAQLRAVLPLFGQRLDAWYTALASSALLDGLRSDPASAAGLNVGAFGVLEDIQEAPRRRVPGQADLFSNPINGGYIHAPGVNQANAAAVLRSVHLSHAARGHGEAFSIDLSSQRVRRALELMDGIRQGQPLAALLGFEIERQLAAESLQRLIAPFRGIAPLLANTLTPSNLPAGDVAATNVVDGLTLLAAAGYDGNAPAAAATLWQEEPSLGPNLSQSEEMAVNRVLAAAVDAIDAVADVTLSESVFQAVQGNPTRAGAATDALSGAAVPPPEIGVVRTPRAGVGVTHRLLVILGDPAANGWVDSPRARAEPRLEAWARATLPSPSQIGIRCQFVDDAGAEVAAVEGLTLADLYATAAAASQAALRLGALDVVATANPDRGPAGSALEMRLRALLELRRPADALNATLRLVFDRGPEWDVGVFGFNEVAEIARQLRIVISRGRPLAPSDLSRPTAPSAASNVAGELSTRASGAGASLTSAIAALQALAGSTDTEAIRAALFAADALNVAGAAPASVRNAPGTTPKAVNERLRQLRELQDQVTTSLAELNKRSELLASLPAGDGKGRLEAIFGTGFVALPTLAPEIDVTAPFAAPAAPADASAADLRAWLGRAARVRDNARDLDTTLAYASSVAAAAQTADPWTLRVAQLGGTANERWIGLPLRPGTAIPGGRVSLVAVGAASSLPPANVAGMFVDEWVEIVPAGEETTSVTFNYDAPSAAAPQVWLLGVPPQALEAWTPAIGQALVEEALALARIRMVDAGDLPRLGQLLPLFVTAENPSGDTIALEVERLTRP